MKVSKLKVIGISLLCVLLFATIGCSDMMNKLGDVHWSATYKVRHMAPKVISPTKISDTEWEVIKTETKTNTVHGGPTEADYLNDLTGFTKKEEGIVQASSVNGDGSTVVDVRYKRNTVTVTFDLNGVEALTEAGDQTDKLEIKDVYVGASDYFAIPDFTASGVVSGVSLYDWREITGENHRSVKQDNVVNDLTTGRVRYTVPTVDTTYRARWIVQSNLGSFENLSDTDTAAAAIPSGKVELQGIATEGNLGKLRNALAKAPEGKEFELDFSGVTTGDGGSLTFTFDKGSTEAAIPALTKVILPECSVNLEWNAFAQCENLESITIPATTNLSATDGGAAFWGSTKLLFDVASDHESLEASGDKKALFWKPGAHPSFSGETGNGVYEGYVLAAYPSATGVVDLRNLGYTITALGTNAMLDATGVTEIHVPDTVKMIEASALLVKAGSDTKLFMYRDTPPALIDTATGGGTAAAFGSSIREIYVPKESLDDYTTAPGWKNYAVEGSPVTFKELAN